MMSKQPAHRDVLLQMASLGSCIALRKLLPYLRKEQRILLQSAAAIPRHCVQATDSAGSTQQALDGKSAYKFA